MKESRKSWSDEEDRAIKNLVKKYGTHRWTDISKQMQDMYALQHRSGKQCRQRWYNHLNPKINKDPWTEEEETILFEAHQQLGNKWKKIAERLNNRTDNSIKNHFYSTMRKKLRRMNKLIGTRNSTSQVREIKPSVLSNIFSVSPEDNSQMKEDFKQISNYIFQFKLQQSYSKLTKTEKDRFTKAIQKINEYNDKYLELKTDENKFGKKEEKNQKQSSSESIIEESEEDEQKDEIHLFIDNLPELHFEGRQSSFRSNVFTTNNDIIQTEMMTSPRLTRSFFRTPTQPTPSKLFSLSYFSPTEIIVNEFNRNETYEDELEKLQREIKTNTSRKG